MLPLFYQEDAFLHAKPLLFGPSLTVVDAGAQFGNLLVIYLESLNIITV